MTGAPASEGGRGSVPLSGAGSAVLRLAWRKWVGIVRRAGWRVCLDGAKWSERAGA